MTKHFLCIAALIATTGCTSFRTTVLYRRGNDSVTLQQTNRKLKGLPVKLKVPSHVHVTIYEEQVILANSESEVADAKTKATEALAKLRAVKNEIELLNQTVVSLEESIADSRQEFEAAQSVLDTPNGRSAADLQAAALRKKAAAKLLAAAENRHRIAIEARGENVPELTASLAGLQAAAEIAKMNSSVGYTLLSFTPAQFHVESELQYTDKIFLVDFKRPAAGVLNLTGASMDEEQYFADVQAEVEERTLSDISSALESVGDVLPNLKSDGATAMTVSADTPETESNQTVNFQKSVIASKRFDISQCGWEKRMQDFVNEHLQRPDLIGQQPDAFAGNDRHPTGNQIAVSLPRLALPYTEQMIVSQDD